MMMVLARCFFFLVERTIWVWVRVRSKELDRWWVWYWYKIACAWAVMWDLHFSLEGPKLFNTLPCLPLSLSITQAICNSNVTLSIQKACKYKNTLFSVLHLLAKSLYLCYSTRPSGFNILNTHILSLSVLFCTFFSFREQPLSLCMPLEVLIIASSYGSQNRYASDFSYIPCFTTFFLLLYCNLPL